MSVVTKYDIINRVARVHTFCFWKKKDTFQFSRHCNILPSFSGVTQ